MSYEVLGACITDLDSARRILSLIRRGQNYNIPVVTIEKSKFDFLFSQVIDYYKDVGAYAYRSTMHQNRIYFSSPITAYLERGP